MKLSDAIGFNPKTGEYVIGTHKITGEPGNTLTASQITSYQRDLNSMLRNISTLSAQDHQDLAAAIVEPIQKVVPYIEIYSDAFVNVNYGELEDNAIPVEDVQTIAWETNLDGAARPVRPGFSWTRPSFVFYDTAIEMPWATARYAGWNVLARSMKRATEDLARKRDQLAGNVWDAAVLPSHVVTVTGGALTKAGIDTVIKNAMDTGFPVKRAIVNPGTLAEMSGFTWPNNLSADRVDKLLTKFMFTDYGGVVWELNPFFSTTEVRFYGDPSEVGWHQTQGSVKNASQVDVINKRDVYLIEDAGHAYYVGSDATLWQILITA